MTPHAAPLASALRVAAQRPAACRGCIDAVLAGLAFRHQEVADHLLDLKLAADRASNPGTCVRLYFELLGRLPRKCAGEMAQVRGWLESLIEVVAERTGGAGEVARLPMALRAESLEEYCDGVIRHFRDITTAKPWDLELRFRFQTAA